MADAIDVIWINSPAQYVRPRTRGIEPPELGVAVGGDCFRRSAASRYDAADGRRCTTPAIATELVGGASGQKERPFTLNALLFYDLVGAGEDRWGTVRPSDFAVFRLTTNSNRVGCSIGRSAGLAPFKILSTSTAARSKFSRHTWP